MALIIQTTQDGSHTLFSEEFDEIYHSRRGAWQESRHVFVEAGLAYALLKKSQLKILEIGFGTGLNAILTLAEVYQSSVSIEYWGIEPLPVAWQLLEQLNYQDFWANATIDAYFKQMHQAPWQQKIDLTPQFSLYKIESEIQTFQAPDTYFDLIYFDAFAPAKQPALWQPEVFAQMYNLLNTNGILVTYCAKGQIKRDLRKAGFRVESLPGPPGKREMTRALKNLEISNH
ncbi:MAG: tRNA (5-methylaminomethyl-2-thiouridine)(34)-methyltransferase MnmD [Microscillaceae bacterium]|jgi:tRNA U34 5-methylaminomethyl-2-thiouridine-forming methyltransferase MnmC|nr:tRNA (5-methylaminomethyl-2-thiouridine)(34)-methyltransferase MnmD [Microscillaceae bacterium]